METLHSKSCLLPPCVQLWDTERHDGNISLVHSSSMRQFNWGYTQFSQFNADDTLLLVSGVYLGPHHSSSGEIAVISLGRNHKKGCVSSFPADVHLNTRYYFTIILCVSLSSKSLFFVTFTEEINRIVYVLKEIVSSYLHSSHSLCSV